MPNLYDIQRKFRTALLQQEREAASQMVQYYGAVYQRIQAAISDLLARVDQAKARGDYSPSWGFQQKRLETLQQQVLAELQRFGAMAGATITAQQAQAILAAQDHAKELILAALGGQPPAQSGLNPAGVTVTFARLPSDAVQDLVGTLQDGSPLKDLLDTIGPHVSQNIMVSLVSGLATGENPRVIARRIRQDAGVGLTRALTIARTETLRSYRTAAIRSYAANDDVVKAWRWTASLSPRTCAVCLAMDGKEFPLDEPFASHPNCRCSPVPVTKTWQELGYDVPETPPQRKQDGAEWFAAQNADVQRQILGAAKWKAYKEGRISLSDLVRYHDSAKWGPVRSEKSLADALG